MAVSNQLAAHPLWPEFREYIETLNLTHFAPEEFVSGVFNVSKGIRNSFPPKELWPNIAKVAKVVDLLRKRLEKPVKITSAYRNPSYNASIKGASRSQHLKFKALDIACRGASSVVVAKELRKMRAEGIFKGGVGRYSTWTHVDIRGSNVDW